MYYCTNCIEYTYDIYKISYKQKFMYQSVNTIFENSFNNQSFIFYEFIFTICGSCRSAGDDIGIINDNIDTNSKRPKQICKKCSSGDLLNITIKYDKLYIDIPNGNMLARMAKDILNDSKLMNPNIDYYEIYYCPHCYKISDNLIKYDDSRYISPRSKEHEYNLLKDEITDALNIKVTKTKEYDNKLYSQTIEVNEVNEI